MTGLAFDDNALFEAYALPQDGCEAECFLYCKFACRRQDELHCFYWSIDSSDEIPPSKYYEACVTRLNNDGTLMGDKLCFNRDRSEQITIAMWMEIEKFKEAHASPDG